MSNQKITAEHSGSVFDNTGNAPFGHFFLVCLLYNNEHN
jgi:hypothetical protein